MATDVTKFMDYESPNFLAHINDSKLHELLFTKDKLDNKDSYFYSSLYFFTNNNFFMNHFLSLAPDNDELKKFNEMINCIYNDMKKKEVSESIQAIKDFKKSLNIFGGDDPRYLIINILIKTLQIENKEQSSISLTSFGKTQQNPEIIKGNSLFTNSESLQKNTEAFLTDSNRKGLSFASTLIEQSSVWLNEEEKIENDEIGIPNKDVVIKVSTKKYLDGKILTKYRYTNYIQLHLSDEEEQTFTLSICLRNYLRYLGYSNDKIFEEPKLDKVFYQLPETLVFVLFFGKEQDDENIENYKYDFDEILDLNQPEYKDLLGPEIEYKKYFLSSLIVCKFPNKDDKQFFYTYCRKENGSKYNIYNCKESKVRSNQEIKNKLQKLKKSVRGDTTSYPFVLVYNAIKN